MDYTVMVAITKYVKSVDCAKIARIGSAMDRVYQFEISRWASKVEIYEGVDRGRDAAYMAIEEDEMSDMIDEMLNELERE